MKTRDRTRIGAESQTKTQERDGEGRRQKAPLKMCTMCDNRGYRWRGPNAEGDGMGYTAETLASLSDGDLDDVVEEMILGRDPEPGLLAWLGKSLAWRSPEDLGPTTPA